jgi:hypothetical protein
VAENNERFHSGPGDERRGGADRRKSSTNPLSLSSLRGRRRCARRSADQRDPHYVDAYDARLLLITLSVLTLSVLDAFLTMKLVACGAEELNPVMAVFMARGATPFLLAKYLPTTAGIVWLLIHKNFTLFQGRIRLETVLTAFACLYVLLVIYELAGIARMGIHPF